MYALGHALDVFSRSHASTLKIECIVEKTYGQWWQSLHRTMLRGVLGKTFRLVGYTIQYGCIAHCAFEYVGGVVMCSGPSMEPTIQNSDIVFAENLSRHFYGIQRGDIVIAKSPSDPKSNICKRVIGLEGDKILTNSPSGFFKSHSYEFLSLLLEDTNLPKII
ncbi:mitochondrial inner membrane protease subunit 1-like [Hippopotamus amphibius kiboko]|uniref:mitochondrial inner membrane protease subunit 1-like n=1 Tax=Hippopotamus amphibius kiboko TaxID=575201 RepID=UPI00259AE0F1|nr:mitochondrial inner membrane protease subunit 1-like [Hippopotamus amphibius kiboko]